MKQNHLLWTVQLAALVSATACERQLDAARDATAPEQVAVQRAALFGLIPCAETIWNGHGYRFCVELRTWDDARSQCQAGGMDLVSIDSSAENAFVLSRRPLGSWIGGNDRVSESQWEWAASGTKFWSGVANGAPVSGRYSNWLAGEPQNFLNEDVALMQAGTGKWLDVGSAWVFGYTCETAVDSCPADPNKLSPGQCGCGKPDTDNDGDGAPNCIDECPADGAQTSAGDCGCPSTPKPQGTACTDGVCGAASVCNGAGVCGNPASCAPDSNCTFTQTPGYTYWFCSNARTWTDARDHCRSRSGTELADVRTSDDNQIIARGVSTLMWIGGNDRDSEGRFRWSQRSTDSGPSFWTGTVQGTPTPGAISSWASAEPDNALLGEDCVFMSPTDKGHWADGNCYSLFGFVCKQTPDTCPADPNKTVPGLCGCGVAETDSDHDGTPDCKDLCPQDPLRVARGTCGCAGASAPAPAGTPCSDGVCSSNTQCDGAGACGTLSQCAPDSNCSPDVHARHVYWTCTNDRSWNDADTRCQSRTRTNLVRVETADENDYLNGRISSEAWIGGNDIAQEGKWRWSAPGNTLFWNGAANGAAAAGQYSGWHSGQPDDAQGADCAALVKNTAEWDDRACSSVRDFVCETCVQRTCAEQNARCGVIADGCGGTVDCSAKLGPCPVDKVCFPSANQCSDGDGKDCRAQLKLDVSLPAEDATRKYYSQVAACAGTNVSSCEAALLGAARDDQVRAANACTTDRISPADHNSVNLDRAAKLRKAIADPSYACRVVAADVDRDLVPDDVDQCLDTPPLTATLANGCTNPDKLPGPDPDHMHRLRDLNRVIRDHDCTGMEMDQTPIPFGFGGSGTAGSVVLYFFPIARPANCDMFYEMQADARLTDGTRKTFHLLWNQSESPFVHPGPTSTISAFTFTTASPGDRGALAGAAYVDLIYTLRARNGNGVTSFWSNPVHAGKEP